MEKLWFPGRVIELMEMENSPKELKGVVKINDDVIATIVAMALAEVKGIRPATGGSFMEELAEKLGKKPTPKGVKIEVDEDGVSVDLSITVEYGMKIPNLVWEVQEKIKETVEEMTGYKVKEVNVTVQGVHFARRVGEREEEG